MATNRADTLDPALLRPGRLDRKIEFPLPSRREKRLIFQTVTSKMNLGPDVDLEDCQSQAKRHLFRKGRVLTQNIYRRFATRKTVISRNYIDCASCRIARYSGALLIANEWY